MRPISRPGFCGPLSPISNGLAPVLGAGPRSGAPGRRISRRLLDQRSRASAEGTGEACPAWGGGGHARLPLAHKETEMTILEEQEAQRKPLVEMSWDPITRIVGSLGIYTKIDF